MTETEKLFEARKEISDYNTSYPLHPSDWSTWKVSDTLSFDDVDDLSFYIHIPFCQSLCRYCEYVKYKKTSDSVEREYLDIVDSDMREFMEQSVTGKTILRGFDIGGGTLRIVDIRVSVVVKQYNGFVLRDDTYCSHQLLEFIL